MPARSQVGWGLILSLILHATGIGVLSLVVPRLNVKPGVRRHVDFAVLSEDEAPRVPDAPRAAAPSAQQPARPDEPLAAAVAVEVTDDPRASVALSPAKGDAPAPVATPRPAKKAPSKPLSAAARGPQPKAAQPKAATPSDLPSSSQADPRSDGSALERVLRQIAATSELTQDERRRAMLIVLRTWEDPSSRRSAEELVDALLENLRQGPRKRAAPDGGIR